MSLVIDVAEAVKEELSQATFSQEFTAHRYYQPLFKLSEMQALHVSVVPGAVGIFPLGRNANNFEIKIDVAVQKKFATGDGPELDSLMDLVEEISEYFRRKRLTDVPEAIWVKTENAPIYAQEHMEQLRQFTSIVTFTFRVQR